MSVDLFGRKIDYLRISITDRCNFRCVYCMPSEGVKFQSHAQIMRYEEFIQVIKVAVKYGVTKIRITGGEPLVRPGVGEFVSMIRSIPEIEDISMTTNGYFLTKFASELKKAGLNRVNVSLDTLKPDLFSKITRGGDFQKTWDGIIAAEEAGLTPIKLNVVAVRGMNDGEFLEFANLTLKHNWQVRFIELMPVKNQVPWGEGFPDPHEGYISTSEMKKIIMDLEPELSNEWFGNGPAKLFQLPGALGHVGFISALEEEHFCKRCNRMRLTADGNLRPCLMSDEEIPLLEALRGGEEIEPLFADAILRKPKKHDLLNNHQPNNRSMMQIGG